MDIFEIIKWWWSNNSEWIKIHDPWVIPVIAVSIPLSLLLRAVSILIKIWRDK